MAEIIDHSAQNSAPVAAIPTASNLILIDNYDSFTWNVYQYLVLEGAHATVFRNDEITLEELIAKNPTQLVISPGPGHPLTDSGISRDAIKYFSGKIPVLGVCMGQQCIFSVFGGKVEGTGEIFHGKTSDLKHDEKGVYSGLSQDLPVTRYHSLAGTHVTLPECLELSSWISSGTGDGKGVIMGVRHKEFVVEGMQFHPESILTEDGRLMIKNFLRMQGGTWEQNKAFLQSVSPAAPTQNKEASGGAKSSILEKIYNHRRAAVSAQKKIPSQRPQDLQAVYDLGLAPPVISFVDRLRQSPFKLALLAEVKRASPSKGIISLDVCAPVQARTYALAGASAISVLTEPEWFKGSIDDMRAVRQALIGMPNRPAVLRKEFIFEEYQILEARVAGADTVLLIVKMLDKETLYRLYQYSQSLGMEPLVEVNTADEMKIAVELGSKVIGVNNRNLTSFEVDMETTTRLMATVPKDTILCALSGITGPQDVRPYQENGVGAVLVGEALMRAKDTGKFIAELLGGIEENTETISQSELLVKVCGTRTPEAAKVAIDAGADLIGIILVQGRKRCVDTSTALAISKVVHETVKQQDSRSTEPEGPKKKARSYFQHTDANHLQHSQRALLVGVFQNQTLDYVLREQKLLGLDVVQLHGSEPIEWAGLIPCPVIRSFQPGDAELGTRGYHALPLLDSGAGGTGEKLAIEKVKDVLQPDEGLRVLLAGGLNAENVGGMIESLGELKRRVVGVDVSSGVESGGHQDLEKIVAFVRSAKSVRL